MATVFSTLTINVLATYELTIPDHWTYEETEENLADLEMIVTIDPDSFTIPDDVTVVGISLDGVEVTYRENAKYIKGETE